jgi:hypothetical protein
MMPAVLAKNKAQRHEAIRALYRAGFNINHYEMDAIVIDLETRFYYDEYLGLYYDSTEKTYFISTAANLKIRASRFKNTITISVSHFIKYIQQVKH